MKLIYSNLKAEMIKKQISIEALAQKLQISKISLEKKLNGHKDFLLNEIEMILRIFDDCAFDYLFQFK